MSIDDPDSEPDPDRSPQRALRVVVTDGRGRVRRADRLRRWLAGVAPAAARGDVVVALVGDRKMRDLNRRFRGVDRPTDVLSFPAARAGEAPSDVGAPDGPVRQERGLPDPDPIAAGPRHLGDIVIATGVARRQARAARHPLGVELRCLALHGLLHLLGYDHERDTGQMDRLEQLLRRQGGVA